MIKEFFVGIAEKDSEIERDKFKLKLVFLSPAAGRNANFRSAVQRAKINIESFETKSRQSVDVIKALCSEDKNIKRA